MAITHALNLLDGLDQLAIGFAFIVSLSILASNLLPENIGVRNLRNIMRLAL
jgi:UDP-N-acetylmuramyl pentapeptide phosphotransferase/UDP-N-acetylglucosamine-1-phosphate transferase